MSAHTPGPWSIGRKLKARMVITVGGKDIASVPVNRYVDNRQNIANADLITAAPDLLRELKNVLEWAVTEKSPLRSTEIASIRAAIAKAEGKP